MSVIAVNWSPPREQLRVFGLICLVAFGVLGTWAYFRHSLLRMAMVPETAQTLAYGFWVAAGACGILALAAPGALRPIYLLLTVVSLPIGFVVSHLVMAIVFFGVLTPIGLIFRLMGRDALERRWDTGATTYWAPRKPVMDVRRYYRQF